WLGECCRRGLREPGPAIPGNRERIVERRARDVVWEAVAVQVDEQAPVGLWLSAGLGNGTDLWIGRDPWCGVRDGEARGRAVGDTPDRPAPSLSGGGRCDEVRYAVAVEVDKVRDRRAVRRFSQRRHVHRIRECPWSCKPPSAGVVHEGIDGPSPCRG